MEVKFYLCLTCGNIVCQVVDSGVTPECCGSEMMLIEPKQVDSGMEKHVPVVSRLDCCTISVKIGELPHPMTRTHHIVMVVLKKLDGIEIKMLDENNEDNEPVAVFSCFEGEAVGVYAYCNLHGMWYTPVVF